MKQSILVKIIVVACGILFIFLFLGSLILIKLEINKGKAFALEYQENIGKIIKDRENEEKSLLEKNIKLHSTILSQTISYDLYNVRPKDLQQRLSSYMEYAEISAIQVVNESNENFAASWRNPEIILGDAIPNTIKLDEMLVIDADSIVENQKVGLLRIYYTQSIIQNKIELLKKNADNDTSTFLANYRKKLIINITNQLTIVGIILVSLMVCLSVAVRVLILKPIMHAATIAVQLSNLDLTVDLSINRKDEIGKLFFSINTFVLSLRSILSKISATTATLFRSSENLSSVSTQMAIGADKMNSQSAVVASAAKQSSASVTNIASMTEELSSTFSKVSENAMKSSHDVTQMAKSVEDISSGINSITVAIEEMTLSFNKVAHNTYSQASRVSKCATERTVDINKKMNALISSSNQIGKVVGVIKEIASQTNMLALNATIEAASAGDAGKGFAVVAGEVKALARRSAEATDEISAQIDQIQTSTKEVGISIEEINKTIEEIAGINETIASAVEEQTTTAREISGAVASNASTVKNVALNAIESANLVEDIARSIDETAKIAKNVACHINELSCGIKEVSNNIEKINTEAKDTAIGASQTQESSKELENMAAELADIVKRFNI
ncbi:MAG: methyl-accepting chemotaxis protein [Desulfobacterales bacterium]|nr:methyl-accepting chemotaxis protein [Desulfobacterales bacterium]